MIAYMLPSPALWESYHVLESRVVSYIPASSSSRVLSTTDANSWAIMSVNDNDSDCSLNEANDDSGIDKDATTQYNLCQPRNGP